MSFTTIGLDEKRSGPILFERSGIEKICIFKFIGDWGGSNEHWLLDDRTSQYKRDVKDGI
ncbi:hypothetical protein ACN6MT_08360 [Neobacillus niacini]|uniref:hypothetical protein n=1 Tax=Neobacillus niacini TaxID=86668 RepID=UPI003B02E236